MRFTSTRMNQVVTDLRETNVSANTLAALVDVSAGYMSGALRGLSKVPSDVELRISETARLLRDLADAVSPLLLPNDPRSLKRILEFVRQNDISAGQIFLAISSVFGDFRNQ
jgi:hypothetical protein